MSFPNSKLIKKVSAGKGKYGSKSGKDMFVPGGNQKLTGSGKSDGLADRKIAALPSGRKSSYGKNHSMADNLPGNTIHDAL